MIDRDRLRELRESARARAPAGADIAHAEGRASEGLMRRRRAALRRQWTATMVNAVAATVAYSLPDDGPEPLDRDDQCI
jgi:hypothetical protein